MKDLILQNAKALVALVCTILYSQLGLDVPLDVQTAVTALFVALAVWLCPNKTK